MNPVLDDLAKALLSHHPGVSLVELERALLDSQLHQICSYAEGVEKRRTLGGRAVAVDRLAAAAHVLERGDQIIP